MKAHVSETPRGPASVELITRRLWKIKLARDLPRYLLCAVSVAGLTASARYTIAPPRPTAPARARPAASQQDLAAEGFAQLFVRSYLTWEADDPEAHERALEQFVGSGIEAGAGLQLPAGGAEHVLWTQVVQERQATYAEHVYTVGAQTDSAGLVYVAVSVLRAANGQLELGSYPAFVGAPASGPAAAESRSHEVSESALDTVVGRALRNYLGSSGAELAADLTGDAKVSLPARALSLEAIQRLDWSAEGGNAVTAVVQARDWRGARYTLAYELDVSRVAGRWEVGAIEMDPDT